MASQIHEHFPAAPSQARTSDHHNPPNSSNFRLQRATSLSFLPANPTNRLHNSRSSKPAFSEPTRTSHARSYQPATSLFTRGQHIHGNEKKKMAPPPRKRAKTKQVEEITFDDDARSEYLTGFHKRKQARIKLAQEQAAQREKEERIVQRKEVRFSPVSGLISLLAKFYGPFFISLFAFVVLQLWREAISRTLFSLQIHG